MLKGTNVAAGGQNGGAALVLGPDGIRVMDEQGVDVEAVSIKSPNQAWARSCTARLQFFKRRGPGYTSITYQVEAVARTSRLPAAVSENDRGQSNLLG